MAERTVTAKPRSRSVLDNDPTAHSFPVAPLQSANSPTVTASSLSVLSSPSISTGPTTRQSGASSSTLPEVDVSTSASPSPIKDISVQPCARSKKASSPSPNLPHSQRITRSSTRQIANKLSVPNSPALDSLSTTKLERIDHPRTILGDPLNTHQPSKKRKAEESGGRLEAVDLTAHPGPSASSKRLRIKVRSPESSSGLSHPPAASTRSRKAKPTATMSSRGSAASDSNHDGSASPMTSARGGRNNHEDLPAARSPTPGPSRYSLRRGSEHVDQDTAMTGTDDDNGHALSSEGHNEDDDDSAVNEDDDLPSFQGSELHDPFGGGFARGPGLPAALSMLGGMLSMSGIGARLRDILNNLRRKEDPSVQLIALQDLSEILLVSNEDNLVGSFSPDPYVRELVSLMQPNELTGEESPEVMLLACRCLANLIEAMPASAANVVYGGAVPVLCQKLLEISFIDLAEQALSTLEKISVEYPSSIVREGGLTACLSYLEFFATSTQRTAVTTAANCCRNIPSDSFTVVRDVMPILLNVLNSNDQRVVEQAALCVSRIVESFKHRPSKLEELVEVDLLKSILRLLLPGSTNHLVGPNLHTQFLRVLALTANSSPRLSTELLKMNVVETLYQVLTGVSPPSGTDDIAAKLDSVLVMQALIHRPKEQVIETLNVVCNLLPTEVDIMPESCLPNIPTTAAGANLDVPRNNMSFPSSRKKSPNEKRLALLNSCEDEVRRFTLILFPTLIDAYSSTVNLDVRVRVLVAQIKMLSNFDRAIILEALKSVPYASFLASILSQQDHLSLVNSALQATELLMCRFGDIYRYQLYREGVINEIEKIAISLEGGLKHSNETQLGMVSSEIPRAENRRGSDKTPAEGGSFQRLEDDNGSYRMTNDHAFDGEENVSHESKSDGPSRDTDLDVENEHGDEDDMGNSASRNFLGEDDVDIDEGEEGEEGEEEDEDDNEGRGNTEYHGLEGQTGEGVDSASSSENSTTSEELPPRRCMTRTPSRTEITAFAKGFLDRHETEKIDKDMRIKATQTLASLSSLADDISAFYLQLQATNLDQEAGIHLFQKLAAFFDSDVFESATSAELLGSGVVHVLERVFSIPEEKISNAAQSAFLESFMGHPVRSQRKTNLANPPITPFSILVRKLQDLLSRSEHFEVVTVHHNTFDSSHSSAASMLAKQIRLRLVATEDSDVPRPFKSIMVSIHAIATFKTLEDYLRPRIALSDRSRSGRDGLSRALAAMAGATPLGAAAAARLSSQLFPSRSLAADSGLTGLSEGSSSQQLQSIHQSSSPPISIDRLDRKSSRLKKTPQKTSDLLSSTASMPSRSEEKGFRRSSRRQLPSTNNATTHPPEEDDPLAGALECADEKHISDDDEELDLSEDNTMEAILGDLDEDMSDNDMPDPSAVHLEMATSDRLTARRKDRTRAFSPSHSSSKVTSSNRASALTAALQDTAPSSSTSDARSSTFASTIQPMSHDWHMEFTLDGKIVPMDSTVYRAILNSTEGNEDLSGRPVWSAVHTVHYRRVSGPSPREPSGFGVTENNMCISTGHPETGTNQSSLGKNPITLSILRLLRHLHDMNANIDDIFVANKEAMKLNAEPLLQFVNTKLTAKLNRQLEEPLIVASNCLPNWSEDLARLYPFLFPFETRHLFLQSTSFGYARSMTRWQNAQVQDESRRDRRDDRPFLGRLQRQKVRISRSRILESAVKVMELYGASQSILEVEYFEEVGTGLGPTLEFYSTVSREFSKKKLKLWRDNDDGDLEFASGPNGLFPRPLSDEAASGANGERIMTLFKALGKFVARSMLDSRIVDINFNPIFFRIGDETSGVRPSLGAVKVVDPALAKSLLLIKKFASSRKIIEEDPARTGAEKAASIQSITIDGTCIDDISLDFTLPGYPEIELIPGGGKINVSIENVDIYVEKVVAMTLGSGVRRQVDAFRKGFSQVFPYSALSAFTPGELVSLFGRVEEDWSLETLIDSIKADHGFTMDSRTVKNLLQAMSEMTPSERRGFLQFTTGSPKLPIGGFRSLTPMFTVVCKPSEAPYSSDDYLPSVMTCVNYLKLPDYTSMEVLKRQLSIAIKEGQGAFHLS